MLICAQAIPLLAQLRIKDSQTYAENDNTAAAYRAAMDARNLQPWATSPYFQLALICKMEGRIARAHVWIKRAIAHDPTDWHLWYAASDLEVRLGQIQQAKKSRDRAFSLNPHSSLFTS
jgi:tetratricopeptide (TPR) repeat protein